MEKLEAYTNQCLSINKDGIIFWILYLRYIYIYSQPCLYAAGYLNTIAKDLT